ncbi:MAG: IclR family transcriptional regulator C-terminal domain-containing protein [Symbiopectobacterium sp.]|uniref:IclR family transcriptional regulator domain-containing protein n=1 Tax=Symbiopectobacterium sp. TaxID=2952789 RepID=UPI0039E9E647
MVCAVNGGDDDEKALEKKLSHISWQTKTASTLTTPEAYRQHLISVRQQGWAFDNEEDIVRPPRLPTAAGRSLPPSVPLARC